jgi:hypothetical protein
MKLNDTQNSNYMAKQLEPSKMPKSINKIMASSLQPRKYIDAISKIQKKLMEERYCKRRKKAD